MKMLNRFRRLSISAQATLLLTGLLVSTTLTMLIFARESGHEAEIAHARSIVQMIDAYRTMISQHGGYYVRREASTDVRFVGRHLASYDLFVNTPDAETKKYTFHHKNPFLALSDYSAQVWKSPVGAKFKMVSDNALNSFNRPDAFESAALTHLRETGGNEFFQVSGGQFRYAQPVKAEKSCLQCHGDPAKAPSAVVMQYPPGAGQPSGKGYGYQVGQIIGLTSVTIPHKDALAMLGDQHPVFWVSLSVIGLLFLMANGLIRRWVVKPLRALTQYANDIAQSDQPENILPPAWGGGLGTSSNEIHMELHALKALHESMNTALQVLRSKPR